MEKVSMTRLLTRARSKALSLLLPRPYQSRWGSYSFVAESDAAPPTERLMTLAIESIGRARGFTFSSLRERLNPEAIAMLDRWPGEHYRLLAAICAVARPKTVIEVGTASGLSALALLAALPAGSRLVSFDIFPWDYRGPETWGGDTLLRADDFSDGRLSHAVGDLSNPSTFEQHRELLAQADLIFIDGPKDGVFERVLLDRLAGVRFAAPPIVMFDDIKMWNMLRIWNDVSRPKLDMTSFGHWSGTGLIDWV
jgi:predicted O-methyltransferase YrrM